MPFLAATPWSNACLTLRISVTVSANRAVTASRRSADALRGGAELDFFEGGKRPLTHILPTWIGPGVLGLALVIVVAIASSVDFALVIGTPPTMIAYSTRLYTAGQIFRKGIVLDVAGILLLVLVVVRIWEALGLT